MVLWDFVNKDAGGFAPVRKHMTDAGIDLSASEEVVLKPGEFKDIPTNIKVKLPPGNWGFLTARSSTFRKLGIQVLNGVIDEGYSGELFFGCWNTTNEDIVVRRGSRLAQLIIIPTQYHKTKQSDFTYDGYDRQEKGFGSTGA